MPTFDNWYASSVDPVASAGRAVLAWQRIQDRATSITVVRDGVAQAAQTVRIEYWYKTAIERGGPAGGEASESDLVLLGVKDHPTVTDTDLERGDRFAIEYDIYEVQDVREFPGEIQAVAVRVQT